MFIVEVFLKIGTNPFCNFKIEIFQSTNVLIETSNFNIGNDTTWDDIDTNTTDTITVPTMNNLTVTTGGLLINTLVIILVFILNLHLLLL